MELSFKNIHWWHWRVIYVSLVWLVRTGLGPNFREWQEQWFTTGFFIFFEYWLCLISCCSKVCMDELTVDFKKTRVCCFWRWRFFSVAVSFPTHLFLFCGRMRKLWPLWTVNHNNWTSTRAVRLPPSALKYKLNLNCVCVKWDFLW